MTDILMPQLSDSMESGLVLAWLIENGEPITVGDELFEVETDKATMVVESEVEGVLTIVVAAGSTVAVGEVLASVGTGAATAPVPETEPAPGTEPVPAPESAQTAEPVPVGASAAIAAGNGANGIHATPGSHGPATPVARRLARAHGVELDTLMGSGPRGRITKEDVLAAACVTAPPPPLSPVRNPQSEPVPPSPQRTVTPQSNGSRIEPLSRLQQLVARRMSEAKSTVPHFQVQTEVVMDTAIALRAGLKQAAVDAGAPAPSLNDLIVKASALALTRHPVANGSYREDGFELHGHVNVGVAVAADGALVVPTIFDTDTKSLGQIAADAKALAEKVRTGTISPAELSGATFTVSNLGMFGMTAITPVINPPQAAILGVGAVRAVLARVDGEIVDRSLLTLTLSCDHRILYGADASRFLAEIRTLLENPYSLCL